MATQTENASVFCAVAITKGPFVHPPRASEQFPRPLYPGNPLSNTFTEAIEVVRRDYAAVQKSDQVA